MSEQAIKIDTNHVRELLRKRYPSPEWSLMEEVAPATGGGTGYADAVAVNLWNSRGHSVQGFEIKVSRSDWLRELKKPAKAESVYQYCDFWWIVAPKGVVLAGELPPTWGLLEVGPASIRMVTQGPKLESKPMTRAFFASLIRRSTENIATTAQRMQQSAVNAAYAQIEERVKQEVDRRTKSARAMEERMAKLKEETGLDFTNSYTGPTAATIRMAQRLETLNGYSDTTPMARLTTLAAELERSAELLRTSVANFVTEGTPS